MYPKNPPEVLSPSEMAYMSSLNERDRRLFLATRAESLKSQEFSYRNFPGGTTSSNLSTDAG